MIRLCREGHYRLIETRHYTKVLFLDDTAYAWVEPPHIGGLLILTKTPHPAQFELASGRYRYYEVEDEPYLSDLSHLELQSGEERWQGYLLLNGLPTEDHSRVRIVPTKEVITGNPLLSVGDERAKILAPRFVH